MAAKADRRLVHPSDNDAGVADSCGVFVSSTTGDDTNGKGTREAPYKTITKGLSKGTTVYVCAGTTPYSEALAIDTPVTLFGALDCGTWAYVAANKTQLTAPADAVPLMLSSSASGTKISDFAITAADATKGGGSSIAVYVNGGTVELVSSNVTAGDAMPGATGMDAPPTPAQGGTNGNSGGMSCSASTVNGAPQMQTTCGATFSVGGQGGTGNQLNGTQGALGLPNNGGGQAGSGDDGTTGWTCGGNGGTGKDGLPGISDMGGAGASMTTFGTLSATGFIGAPGSDGAPGTPGQGGGGGGGVRGSIALCGGQPGSGGASGGSGGSGGCGGLPGRGGGGGGASIALVSASASVTLTNVKLSAGNGGNGGNGGNPQQGGAGSSGGLGGTASVAGLQPGCNGGAGGKGGDGGPGGGGRGGHSLGIASSGTAPQIAPNNITTKTAGSGGKGGSNDVEGNDGAGGIAASCWDFELNMACQ